MGNFFLIQLAAVSLAQDLIFLGNDLTAGQEIYILTSIEAQVRLQYQLHYH